MSSSYMTKYLLLVPGSYILYCIYQDYKLQSQKQQQKKAQQSESIRSLKNRFQKCQSTIELANIYKKSFHYLRSNITQPSRQNEQVIDCEILQSGKNSEVWWISPYNTRSLLSLNSYQNIQNKKQGFYSIFFWYDVLTKQSLKLKNTKKQIDSIISMVKLRQDKCLQISQKYEKQSSNYFFECIKKTEPAVRFIEKELHTINLINSYQAI